MKNPKIKFHVASADLVTLHDPTPWLILNLCFLS